jgi:hypothetical protein
VCLARQAFSQISCLLDKAAAMQQRPYPKRSDGAMSHSRSDPDCGMFETSSILRPAVRAYLKGQPMTAKNIAALRTYLRLWVFAPDFDDDGVEALRQTVDGLASREAIEDWLATARKEWVSPL